MFKTLQETTSLVLKANGVPTSDSIVIRGLNQHMLISRQEIFANAEIKNVETMTAQQKADFQKVVISYFCQGRAEESSEAFVTVLNVDFWTLHDIYSRKHELEAVVEEGQSFPCYAQRMSMNSKTQSAMLQAVAKYYNVKEDFLQQMIDENGGLRQ